MPHYDNEKRRVRLVASGIIVLTVLFVLIIGFFALDYWGSRDTTFDLAKYAAEECSRKGGVPQVSGHYGQETPDVNCKMPSDR